MEIGNQDVKLKSPDCFSRTDYRNEADAGKGTAGGTGKAAAKKPNSQPGFSNGCLAKLLCHPINHLAGRIWAGGIWPVKRKLCKSVTRASSLYLRDLPKIQTG